jgi:hypothetical protein
MRFAAKRLFSINRTGKGRAQVTHRRGHEDSQALKALLVISKLAFRLNQNSSNRSHEPIGGVYQVFEVLRCLGLKGSHERFVEVL